LEIPNLLTRTLGFSWRWLTLTLEHT
jgi:hypothetical protein